MESLIERLANLGGIGILAGALLWIVMNTQKKLFSVIENNTRALTELKETIQEHLH